MFDGTPLPPAPWEDLLPALVLAALSAALFAVLRLGHPGEWALTWSGLVKPRSMWMGRHGEGGRSAGVGIGHALGVCSWGLIGWAAGLAPWEGPGLVLLQEPRWWGLNLSAGAFYGMALGGLTLPMRWAARQLGGWMAEVPEATWQHGETDRLLRNVLAALLVVEVLLIAVQSRVAEDVVAGQILILFTCLCFLVLRSFRLLQLFQLSKLSIGWGIAYLCTLELIPSWVLISALLAW